LVDVLLKDSTDEGATRVLLTNRPNAILAQQQNDELACFTIAELTAFKFQLGFAVHPDERRLLDAVNAAIGVLASGRVFERVLRPYRDSLAKGGVELEDVSEAPRAEVVGAKRGERHTLSA
jgi:hypothetical protein